MREGGKEREGRVEGKKREGKAWKDMESGRRGRNRLMHFRPYKVNDQHSHLMIPDNDFNAHDGSYYNTILHVYTTHSLNVLV